MVIGDLIDLTSVDGGCFDLGSATFCIARVLTGEMDAYVDVGQRMVEEVDAVKPVFERVGHGAILNNYPYDLAAAALIASESGATVTDAYGGPLWNRPLVTRGGRPASVAGRLERRAPRPAARGDRPRHEAARRAVRRRVRPVADGTLGRSSHRSA